MYKICASKFTLNLFLSKLFFHKKYDFFSAIEIQIDTTKLEDIVNINKNIRFTYRILNRTFEEYHKNVFFFRLYLRLRRSRGKVR